MRTRFLLALGVVAVIVGAVWWWQRSSLRAGTLLAPTVQDAGTVTIGVVDWPGYVALYVARDQGYFRDAGLNVEIKRYAGLAELSQDYIAGKMQGRANISLDMVNEALGGLSQKVILVIDHSSGADAILARPDIHDLSQAKGLRVAYEFNTLEEFLLTWALRQYGLSLADIHGVSAMPEDALKLLLAGTVDAAVSYEPFISPALAAGTTHVVYSSKDAPGLIADLLTFRTDFLNAHPNEIHRLLQAYFKAFAFWKEHPNEAHAIVAKELHDTPENIAAQYAGVKVLDEAENATAFTFSGGIQSLYGNLRQVGEFVLSHRQGAATFDTDKLIDRTFIKALAEERAAP